MESGQLVPGEAELERVTESFRAAYGQAATLPDQTRAVFDQLMAALRLGTVGGGVVAGGAAGPAAAVVGGAVSGVGNLVLGDIEGRRDEILAKLDELLGHLQDAARGIAAPYTFITYAAEWQRVGGEVRAARNAHFDQGDLTGYWEGTAADRYSAAREKQDAAFEAAEAMCDKVHENLLALSETGRDFYAEIGTDVLEFLTDFGAALAKIATVVGAPFGISDAIDLVAKYVVVVKEIIDRTLNLVVLQKITSNELGNATNSPYGMPGDRWPKATADTFSDATVTDGTPSSWEISA
jgi:hypothetical protein